MKSLKNLKVKLLPLIQLSQYILDINIVEISFSNKENEDLRLLTVPPALTLSTSPLPGLAGMFLHPEPEHSVGDSWRLGS